MFKLVGIWVQVPGGLNMLNYLYSKKKNVGLKFRVVLLIKDLLLLEPVVEPGSESNRSSRKYMDY